MSDLYISIMEEYYIKSSNEEKIYIQKNNQDQIFWEQNCDNSP